MSKKYKSSQMGIRLTEEQAVVVNQFQEKYEKFSDSDLIREALTYYMTAIGERGMSVFTFQPNLTGSKEARVAKVESVSKKGSSSRRPGG